MEDLSVIKLVGGGISAGGIITALIAWLLTRVVKTEDTSKAALAVKAGELEKRANGFELQLNELKLRSELSASETATKLATLASSVGELKGLVSQLGHTIEQNRDKMSAFYRNELRDLETKLTSEMKELERTSVSKRK